MKQTIHIKVTSPIMEVEAEFRSDRKATQFLRQQERIRKESLRNELQKQNKTQKQINRLLRGKYLRFESEKAILERFATKVQVTRVPCQAN